jgi:hypothetical protein
MDVATEPNLSGRTLGKQPSMALDSDFPAGMTNFLALAEASILLPCSNFFLIKLELLSGLVNGAKGQ